MSVEILKPCPFCGGKARIRYSSFWNRWCREWAVECETCKTIAGDRYKDTEEEAISVWQRRYKELGGEK